MKINLISTSSGSRGGGEFYLHSLAQKYDELGHESTTYLSTDPQMDEFAEMFGMSSLDVLRWPYKNTYHRRMRSIGAAYSRLDITNYTGWITRNQPDILHINQQCVEDGLDLLQAAKRSNLPVVSTVHVTRSMTELSAVAGLARDFISRRVFRKCKLDLIGISTASANDLDHFVNGGPVQRSRADTLGIRPSSNICPVHTVNNGVKTPDDNDAKQFRKDWGIPADGYVLGCVARIEEQKNPLFIPKLLSLLPKNIHFVWIGDGQMRSSLEAAVRDADIENRFHFDGWRQNASERMAGFDAFILPSHYEGLPLALLEAMALGLPTVVSDVDGVRNAVIDGKTGFLCPVNDVEAWITKIKLLRSSPELMKSMSSNSIQRHRDEFSLSSMAERTIEVYRKVIERHGAKR